MNVAFLGTGMVGNALAALFMALALAGCGAINATLKDAQDRDLMLLGHDPVAYFEAGRQQRGDPGIAATHEGRTYYFASEARRRTFLADPAKYEPQYGGFCSSGMAYGVKFDSDPTAWTIVDGRLFIFGDILGREHWKLDQDSNIRDGDALWAAEAKEAGWRAQTIKRIVLRVPHYRTGRELTGRWEALHPGRTITYNPGGTVQNLFMKYPGWRAREGFSQPALGIPGVDACPPACPGEFTQGSAEP